MAKIIEAKKNDGKKMRAAGIVFFGAFLAALPVMAQQDTPPPPPSQGQMQGPPPGGPHGDRGGMNPERRLQMMQRELNLTPAQSTQVKGIMQEGRGKMEALHADTTLPPDDKQMKMMEIRKHETDQIRSLLTPDQQPKFDAMLARQRERMRDRRENGEGAPPQQPPPATPQQ